MSLDLTPKALHEEWYDALQWQRKRLGAIDDMILSYQTPWHKGDTPMKFNFRQGDPRNHAYEFLALTLAQNVFDNPRYQIRAKRDFVAEVDAPALEAALNRQVKDIDIKKLFVKSYVDFCFSQCIAVTQVEPEPVDRANDEVLKDGKRMRARPRRVGPKRAFIDYRSFEREESRYFGDVYIRDLNDLIEDAQEKGSDWNLKVLRNLKADAGIDDIRTEGMRGARSRGEIALMQGWVPEHTLPDSDPFWKKVPDEERQNYHGTIFTLPYAGWSTNGRGGEDWPKPPIPFHGPKRGPYSFGGTYYVPDDPMMLSQLVAVQTQNLQNNGVMKALIQSIIAYKRIMLTANNNPTLTAAVKRAKHGDVLPANLQDLARMIAQMELGGPTAALIQGAQITQDNFDRSAGTTEAYQGNVTGEGTAYENSLAAAGSQSRNAFPKQQFTDYMANVGWQMAWQLHNREDVIVDVGAGAGTFLGGDPDAHREYIVEQLMRKAQAAGLQITEKDANQFVDFRSKVWRATPLESLDIGVEPLSTERASDAANRARVGAVVPLILQLAQAAPMMPWLDFREIFGWVGQAFDMPDLLRTFNAALAKQAGQQMQQQGAQQPDVQPQMSGDVAKPQLPARRPSAMIGPTPQPPTPQPTKQKKRDKSNVRPVQSAPAA